MKTLKKPEALEGKFVRLRLATEDDAKFTLDLRLEPHNAKRFNTAIDNDIEKQKKFIRKCLNSDSEYFFIIERKDGKSLGTVSLYDIRDKSATGGRWCMTRESSAQESLEGDCLFKNYVFNVLGFHNTFFSVLKSNKKVIRYHKNWQSVITDENEKEVFFTMTADIFNENRRYFEKMLYE